MGTHSELAAHIKKWGNLPAATVGRITEAWIAEKMVANGMADACMIGRANLCDPEFSNGYHVDSAMEDMWKATGAVYHLMGDGMKVSNIKDAVSGVYEIARTL